MNPKSNNTPKNIIATSIGIIPVAYNPKSISNCRGRQRNNKHRIPINHVSLDYQERHFISLIERYNWSYEAIASCIGCTKQAVSLAYKNLQRKTGTI